MSTTVLNVQKSLNNNVTFTNLFAPDNTKGTLLVNDGTGVNYLPVGSNGTVLTSTPASALDVSWVSKPTGVATNSITYLIAGLEVEAGATGYSTFAYPSAINGWMPGFCEGICIAYSNVETVRTTIKPAGNDTWGAMGASGSFVITLGKLTGGGVIGVSGTFTPYAGTGAVITVDSSNASTRNVIITDADISVVENDSIAVRCVGTVGYSLFITVCIFIRGALAE